jgi:hypothetical protein
MVTISAYEPRHTNCGVGRVSPSLDELLKMNDLCSFAVKAKSLETIIDFAKQHPKSGCVYNNGIAIA